MALKITTPIHTDCGTLNEAYIRLSDYHITKYGRATFSYEIWPSKEESVLLELNRPAYNNICLNQQIGNHLDFDLRPAGSMYSDLSIIDEKVFSWAYSQLKTKLEGIVGEGNVVDC
jgi:hypothetical protein